MCLVLWCRELLSKTRVNMYLMCKLGRKTRKPVKLDLTCAKLVNSVKIVQNHPSLCFRTFLILYARYSSLSFVLCLKKERWMRKEGKNMVGMLQHLPKTVFFFKWPRVSPQLVVPCVYQSRHTVIKRHLFYGFC